ncbi:MAG: hypothetical protein ACI8T1_001544 [Verrucomicrobiales bacterium]
METRTAEKLIDVEIMDSQGAVMVPANYTAAWSVVSDANMNVIFDDPSSASNRSDFVTLPAEIQEIIQQSDYVHTDDTGWRTGGKQSHLMGFGSLVDQAVYYQIRDRHRAREVAEVISEIFKGVLNTDRFKSYDAAMFALVTMQKCLSRLLKNLSTVLEKRLSVRLAGPESANPEEIRISQSPLRY